MEGEGMRVRGGEWEGGREGGREGERRGVGGRGEGSEMKGELSEEWEGDILNISG